MSKYSRRESAVGLERLEDRQLLTAATAADAAPRSLPVGDVTVRIVANADPAPGYKSYTISLVSPDKVNAFDGRLDGSLNQVWLDAVTSTPTMNTVRLLPAADQLLDSHVLLVNEAMLPFRAPEEDRNSQTGLGSYLAYSATQTMVFGIAGTQQHEDLSFLQIVLPEGQTARLTGSAASNNHSSALIDVVIPAQPATPPTNNVPPQQSLLEDASLVFWAANGNAISISDENQQGINRIRLSAANGTLSLGSTAGLSFSSGDGSGDATMTFTGAFAGINAALGNLTFQPSANYVGATTVTIESADVGDAQTDVDAISVVVAAVNDPPIFVVGANQVVDEDAAIQIVTDWATSISAGAADESYQQLTFIVTAANPALFDVQPALSPTGALMYTPAANVFGSTDVSVTLHDNGGIANGGGDTSSTFSFTIQINPVNDAPSFDLIGAAGAVEDAGAVSVPNAVTNISAGAGESEQSVRFQVVAVNPLLLFAVPPAISTDGTLSFTPAANTNGSTQLIVVAIDDGATGGANDNASDPKTLTLTVTAANSAPQAAGQAVNVELGGQIDIQLLGQDVETAQADLVYTITAPPQQGTLTDLGGGLFRYAPSGGVGDTDSFQFTVTDTGDPAGSHSNPSDLVSQPATVAIQICRVEPLNARGILQYRDSDSSTNLVTVSLPGGTGTLYFPKVSNCPPSLIVLNPVGERSKLKIASKAITTVGDIEINGPVGGIAAKTTDLTGSLTIGAAVSPKAKAGITLHLVQDGGIDSEMPLGTLSVGSWSDTDGQADLLAPRLDSLKVAGNFQADLEIAGAVGKASIGGNLDDSDWLIRGALSSLNVKGTASQSTVQAMGSIASLSLGASLQSHFLAGIRLPAAGEQLTKPAVRADFFDISAKIGKIQIRGFRSDPAGTFVQDSTFSAASLGTVSLLNVDFSSGGLYMRDSATQKELKTLRYKGPNAAALPGYQHLI